MGYSKALPWGVIQKTHVIHDISNKIVAAGPLRGAAIFLRFFSNFFVILGALGGGRVRSRPDLQKSGKPTKTRLKPDREGPGKFPRGPLPYGMPQKRPFRVGSKLFTSRKRRRAARPAGQRTLRSSSSLTKKARSKPG